MDAALTRPAHKTLRAHAPRLAREQRMDEILCAARDVFCKQGYEATAVAQIADRIGVVEGTIYKYFATKRELLLRVLEQWYEEIFGQAASEIAGIQGARARLRRLVWCHLRSIRDYPLLCRLMFREVRGEQDYRGSDVHALNRRYTALLVGVIEQGVAGGEFRDDLPIRLLRDLVYGGVEHATWNYVCGRGDLDIEAIADQISALVCEGLLRREANAQAGVPAGPRGRKIR